MDITAMVRAQDLYTKAHNNKLQTMVKNLDVTRDSHRKGMRPSAKSRAHDISQSLRHVTEEVSLPLAWCIFLLILYI